MTTEFDQITQALIKKEREIFWKKNKDTGNWFIDTRKADEQRTSLSLPSLFDNIRGENR